MALDKVLFKKVCVRLASEHEGERSNAAKHASSMLEKAGLTWTQFIDGITPVTVRAGLLHQRQALWCLDFELYLTDWEKDFCISLAGNTGSLTLRQTGRLSTIMAKLENEAGELCPEK